jgi:tryptophan halogenase
MKICIIGGGTTGWWAAGYLESELPDAEITLIESDVIPIVGVGESTLPQIASFFTSFGMMEADWMDKCNAIHKYGNIKSGWTQGEDVVFSFWENTDDRFDSWLTEYQAGRKTKQSLTDEFYFSNQNKQVAYHLDAEHAGAIVKNSCKRVIHLTQTLTELPAGYDLYLDCTGFRQRFVQDKTQMPLEHHLVDSAWVCPYDLQAPYNDNYTRTIARDNGWQFVIGLQNRIGTGYVFSSQHTSAEQALEDFHKYNSHLTPYNNRAPRLLMWKPSVLANPWSGNVVAIGLSSGFIDPLESNALFMTQFAITNLAKCIKRDAGAVAYNKLMRRVWQDNSTYIQHHYMLSNRQDTEFWNYYNQFRESAKKTLWENYHKYDSFFTNLYPNSIWATLALYYDEFEYYEKKSG